MAYHERGEGPPVLFLHGNPTSSYLWRDVIPELRGARPADRAGSDRHGRFRQAAECRAGHLPLRHPPGISRAFIDAVIGKREQIVLVVHDWGSALGFDWANHHRDRVRGIAYMEAIVRPIAGWDEWSAAATPIFQGFRSDKGEEMILDRNMFVERVLPGSVLRKLSEAEMAEYRKPFLEREDRWPTLTWPRQIPIAGEPADVVQIAAAYSQWMAANELPKLFVNAEPGAILIGALREFCRTLAKPDRGHGAGFAFHPGGFRRGDRPGDGRLDDGEIDLTAADANRDSDSRSKHKCDRAAVARRG